MPPIPKPTLNATTLFWFLFQNIGGLLALGAVLNTAGGIIQRVTALEENSTARDNTMVRIEQNTNMIRTDVEVIRERVSTHHMRINNLEGRKNEIHPQR